MKTRTQFCRAALLFLLLAQISACGVVNYRNPTVQVKDASYERLSLKAGRLNTRLAVNNPNSFQLPVKALSYQLYLNDKEFVAGQASGGLNLGAGETREINFPIELSYQKLINSLGSMVMTRTIRFQVKGELDFGLFKTPYSKIGEFKLY